METFANIKNNQTRGGECLTLTLGFAMTKSTFKLFLGGQITNFITSAEIIYIIIVSSSSSSSSILMIQMQC